MKHVLIENAGELDVSSLILLGASTKREDDSKIGFFGSGNKYAIATLIRMGVGFKIFSGDREIVITTSGINFRGHSFEQIHIDGQPTSLTTDMGPQWEEWMALREWVSNSLDEGQSNIVIESENLSGREGYTRFFIEHSSGIQKVIDDWNLYFTFDREDVKYENQLGRLYNQSNMDETMVLFRKGIRVSFTEGTTSLYHYDLNDFEINESRIISSLYDAGHKMIQYLNTVTDINILRNILKNATKGSYFESRLSWKWGLSKLSDHWKTAIDDSVIIVDEVSGYFQDIMVSKSFYIVTAEMALQIKRSFPEIPVYGINEDGNQVVYKKVEVTKKMEFLLKECLSFLEETEYVVANDIEIVEFDRTEVLGLAEAGKILLAPKLFELGKKEIVRTIVEEQEHLRSGLKDCTRGFQNHWINLFISEKEERFGHFL
jgi:hypothetical protein